MDNYGITDYNDISVGGYSPSELAEMGLIDEEWYAARKARHVEEMMEEAIARINGEKRDFEYSIDPFTDEHLECQRRRLGRVIEQPATTHEEE